jgi:Endonuclease/Exonuclease/phosphatase family
MDDPELNIYLLTFNCARNPVNPEILSKSFFRALPSSILLPDVIAISLQELSPIAYSFLGGSLVTPYFDAVRKTVSQAISRRAQDGLDFEHVLTRHVGMTGLMIFTKPGIKIKQVKTAGVGVGLWDMGNKGAVAARVTISSTSIRELELTFVGAHLAPFEWEVKRRNQDFKNIVRNLVFRDERLQLATGTSSEHWTYSSNVAVEADVNETLLLERSKQPRGLYDTTGHVFFAGDLNYRTSDVAPRVEDYELYPQPGYPPDSEKNILNFLNRDQLNRERKEGRTFHGFDEFSPIKFPPTYKYKSARVFLDEGAEPASWPWANHRVPSWCDRILYIPSEAVQTHSYDILPIQSTSDHRPVALSLSVRPTISQQLPTEPPYRLNPDFAELRAAARNREFIVGILAYLGVTKEGNTILAGVMAGLIAGWYIMQYLS